MLLWQHNVRKRLAVWGKFLLAASTLHTLFFVLLFMHDGERNPLHITASSFDWSQAKIVVLPFHKVAPVTLRGSSNGRSGSPVLTNTARASVPHKKTATIKKPSTMLKTETKKKNDTALLKKKKERDRILQRKKEAAEKKERTEKKRLPEAAKKKHEKKSVEQQEVKTIEKKTESAAVPQESSVAPEKQVVADAAQSSVQTLQAVATHPEGSGVSDGTIYVGQAELDGLKLQQEIQQEIEMHWRPPVGLADAGGCQIKAFIDGQGMAVNLQMVKASGVLLYDVSARAAMQAICFPPIARGKELVITFS